MSREALKALQAAQEEARRRYLATNPESALRYLTREELVDLVARGAAAVHELEEEHRHMTARLTSPEALEGAAKAAYECVREAIVMPAVSAQFPPWDKRNEEFHGNWRRLTRRAVLAALEVAREGGAGTSEVAG